MKITLVQRFEKALADNQLNNLVQELVDEGKQQVEVYDQFDQFRTYLREVDREDDENKVMDTMDYIVGWCSSDAQLFPNYLTNEEIDRYQEQQRLNNEGGI